jgi:hypothetical protein
LVLFRWLCSQATGFDNTAAIENRLRAEAEIARQRGEGISENYLTEDDRN